MKSLTVKQAERWFDKLKSNNPAAFKDILKYLKKFEKTNDQYDCFVKINTVLLDQPQLTRDLNNYLEDSNKFIVNRTEVERINELVKYVKKVKPQAFEEIVSMIKDLSARRNNSAMSEQEQNRILKDFVLQKVKGNSDLQNYADKALNYSAQEMVKKLDLNHLVKVSKAPPNPQKNEQSLQLSYYQPPRAPVQHQQLIIEQFRPKIRVYPPFININEEKMFIRNLQSILAPQIFEGFLKVIEIYRLGIITRSEALQFVKPLVGIQYEGIKDIFETRESDRRRNCPFRPLNDIDFSNSERATHSYVNMPFSYPHICSSSNKLTQQTLNRKWVSVPQGSQDQFNLRIRNSFEENLIRSEDDRYQLDLNIGRMKKTLQIIEQVIEILSVKPSADVLKQLKIIIRLGIIQIIYKNATKQQKDELQYYLKKNTLTICQIFRDRIKGQMIDLCQTRTIHGIKLWNDVATKNTQKALDFKGHEFKRTQKFKLKPAVFLEQLKAKNNYLQKKGISRDFETPFEEKRQFFSVLNSFETTSRKERCLNRKIAQPMTFDICSHSIPSLLPAMILAFEDQKALELTFSYMSYFIDNNGTNQTEKVKCSNMLRLIMSQFFGFSRLKQRKINVDTFNEQKFYATLLNDQKQMLQGQNIDNKTWIIIQEDSEQFKTDMEQLQDSKMKFRNDKPSEYNYLPLKTQNNLVFFASQNFYVFLRFFYSLYERIIRLYQVCGQNQQKTLLFELLYFNSIKSKQNAKLEQYLNHIFNQNAYIFTTFYKLIEALVKSLLVVINCPVTNYSLKLLFSRTNEDMYLLLLNKYYLLNNINSAKILRFTYQKYSTKLLYINCLQSFYKSQQQNKQLQRRRFDISHKVETYTVMRDYLQGVNPGTLISNGMQYHFEGNTIKLVNLTKGEDIIVSSKYNISDKKDRINLKRLEKQISKIIAVNDYLN